MNVPRQHPHWRASTAERVQWLVDNPEIWRGWRCGDAFGQAQIIKAMRRCGLFSPTSNTRQIRLDVLIAHAQTRVRTIPRATLRSNDASR